MNKTTVAGAVWGIYPVSTFRDGCRDRPWVGNENVTDGMNIPSGLSKEKLHRGSKVKTG